MADEVSDKDFQASLQALMDELKNLPGNIEQGALKRALEEAAVIMAAGASQMAPVAEAPRTVNHKSGAVTYLPGFLKTSFRAAKPRVRRGQVSVGVIGAYYARFVEKGHTVKWGKKGKEVGHVPANPFIRRAFDANQAWALDVARRMLVEEIGKRISQLQRKVNKASGG